MCSRWWACSGSVHAFVGLVILPALAFSPVALGVSGTARRLWRGPQFGFLALSVEFYAGCSAPLARTSQVGLVALSPGEALTRLLGLLLLDLTLLLIGAETAGGVMTKLIVRNITVLGALNSDVHAKLPFLLESSLADVLCCLALAFCVRPAFSTFARGSLFLAAPFFASSRSRLTASTSITELPSEGKRGD